MNMDTKQEIIKDKIEAYLAADKKGGGQLLDHLVTVTGFHHQALIRRLWQLVRRNVSWRSAHRGRRETYGPAITFALRELWELASNICAERLHPHLAEYVAVLQRCRAWHHPEQTTRLLLQISLGTVKARLLKFRRVKRRGGQSATKPSQLKELVPIRTGPWKNPEPGYGEVDTVAHCGHTLHGDYAYTVQYTDVAVIWTLLQVQWNKGMAATKQSLQAMRARLPFPIRGFDFDSGREFINEQVIQWCHDLQPPIATTRTRPYRKNDHGRIEQKNYANVRQFVGYIRYDQPEQVALINALYLVLEDYLNFFIPSMKCVQRIRIGSRYRRSYDQAQTAYQRVLQDKRMSDEVKMRLKEKYATLNPMELKVNLDRLQRRLVDSVRRGQQNNKLQ